MKDPKLKAKGRANGALRIGIREAKQQLLDHHPLKAIETLDRAVRRADRIERDA